MRTVIEPVQEGTLLAEERFQLVVDVFQFSFGAIASRDHRLVRNHHRQESATIQASDGLPGARDEFELIRRTNAVHFLIERAITVEKHRGTRVSQRPPLDEARGQIDRQQAVKLFPAIISGDQGMLKDVVAERRHLIALGFNPRTRSC